MVPDVQRDRERAEDGRELGEEDGGRCALLLPRRGGGVFLRGVVAGGVVPDYPVVRLPPLVVVDLVRRIPAPALLAVTKVLEVLDAHDEDAGSGIARPSDEQGHRRPPSEETTTSEDHHVADYAGWGS